MFCKRIFYFMSSVLVAFVLSPVNADNILFIGGKPEPTHTDDPFAFAHLEAQGYDVTYRDDDVATTADADAFDAIVISGTASSNKTRGKWSHVAVPILNWEENLTSWDDSGKVGSAGGGPAGNFRMVEFSNHSNGAFATGFINIAESAVGHPLTAGLPAGLVQIYEDPGDGTLIFYGELAPGTFGVAEIDPDVADAVVGLLNPDVEDVSEASHWVDANGQAQVGLPFTLTAIDTGGELGPAGEGFGGAPARRVNFPLENSGFATLTDDGLKLFNCAVEWVLGRNCLDDGNDVILLPDLNGDYNDSGVVELGDLNLVLFNWNADEATLPVEWINHRPAAGESVGLDKLNGVLFNWGKTVPLTVAVPEPGGILLLVAGLSTFSRRRMVRGGLAVVW